MELRRNRRVRVFAILLPLLAVATVALSQNQIIYDDALENGWQQWDWTGTTVNLANTSPVHSGSHSLSVTFSNANYGALYLEAGASFNTSAYTNLTFWINGGATGGQLLQV